MAALLRGFSMVQKSYPSLTSLSTGMLVMGAGDAAVQLATGGTLDLRRTAVSSSYSGVSSPGIYHWWRALDATWPGAALRSVCNKVLVNQAVLGPLNCALFLTWSHCLNGVAHQRKEMDAQPADVERLVSEACDRIRREVPDLALKAMGVWVPVHMITFRFVPPHLRILYTSSVSVLWGGYLSYVAHGGQHRGDRGA